MQASVLLFSRRSTWLALAEARSPAQSLTRIQTRPLTLASTISCSGIHDLAQRGLSRIARSHPLDASNMYGARSFEQGTSEPDSRRIERRLPPPPCRAAKHPSAPHGPCSVIRDRPRECAPRTLSAQRTDVAPHPAGRRPCPLHRRIRDAGSPRSLLSTVSPKQDRCAPRSARVD